MLCFVLFHSPGEAFLAHPFLGGAGAAAGTAFTCTSFVAVCDEIAHAYKNQKCDKRQCNDITKY